MPPMTLQIEDAMADAIEANIRIRGLCAGAWIEAAIRSQLAQDVARIRPLGARNEDDEQDRADVEALLLYLDTLRC
ncbi:hypothetical protein N9H93_02725 [Rhizobiaceae bacterium]|nr:hypothetical protein [Rhizobiaceae bacterium]